MELKFMNLTKKNTKKDSEIPTNRVWKNIGETSPIDLPKLMKACDKIFNNAYSSLYADNRAIFRYNPTYKRRKIFNKKKTFFLENISSDSEKLLNKLYTKINFMKNETKELQKLNTISMQKTSKSYFRTNRPKTSNIYNPIRTRIESSSYNRTKTNNSNLSSSKALSKDKLRNNHMKNQIKFNSLLKKNDKNNIYTIANENTKDNTYVSSTLNSFPKRKHIVSAINKSKKFNNLLNIGQNKSSSRINTNYNFLIPGNLFEDKGEEKFRDLIDIDVNKLYSTNKKKQLNLARLNDIYRVQMNKSFGNHNTENHLKELNKIQRDNISVRKDMEKIKQKMNQKINDRCQGLFYKKQYLKFKQENEKEKMRKSLAKKPFPINIPFNILFRDTKEHKNVRVFPHGYKVRAFYDYCFSCDRIQRAKDKDLIKFGADLLFGHLNNKNYELLYNSLDEVFNTLEVEPITKYIDTFKNEKPIKDKELLKDRIKNYFPVLIETEKKLQKMGQYHILKKRETLEKDILDKISETKKLLSIDN